VAVAIGVRFRTVGGIAFVGLFIADLVVSAGRVTGDATPPVGRVVAGEPQATASSARRRVLRDEEPRS